MRSAPRDRACKTCKAKFKPRNSLHVCCSPDCAIKYSEAARTEREARAARDDLRRRKEAIKSLSQVARETQEVVNKYVRMRDANEGCISCDKPASWHGQWHASHLHSVGARPDLRFDLMNIHKSCSICNNWLSGNEVEYRRRFVLKFGQAELDRLDQPFKAKKYSRDELMAIREDARKKIREIDK